MKVLGKGLLPLTLLAAGLSPAWAQDVGAPGLFDDYALDFTGYLRAGIGGSLEGGDQVCFQAPGARAKYRLGNECEVYSELGLAARVYEGEQGETFTVNTRLAYVVEGENDFEQFSPAFREAWVGANNLFGGALEGASFWAGKRFYRRHDVHINDFYYWDATGNGGGIEDVDVGLGKVAYAYFRNTNDDFNEFEITDNLGETRTITGDRIQVNDRSVSRHDLRWYDIPVNEGGLLTVGGDVRFSDEDREGFEGEGGFMATVIHMQTGVWGGFNKIAFQYGQGAASTLANFSEDTFGDDERTFRVVESLVVQPTEDWSAMATAIWERRDSDNAANQQDWMSFGVRPVYHFTDHVALAFEAGYDRVDPDQGDTRELAKFTVAPTLTAGRGFFDRPQLRAFVTYAAWNDAAGAAGLTGTGNDTNDITFGIQAEAWW